jgi:hypothetical protein
MKIKKINYSINFLQSYKKYFEASSLHDYEEKRIFDLKDTKWTLGEVKQKLIEDKIIEK